MLALLLLVACQPAPPAAEQLAYGDSTVAATLDRLVAAEQQRAAAAGEADETVSPARVEALEERVARLELRIAQLDTQGVLPAAQVGYDPRKTTLGAQDLQSAVDELYARVKAAEEAAEPGMGRPGPGMFTQPTSGPSGPGGMGPPGGAKGGPPPGGPPPGGGKK